MSNEIPPITHPLGSHWQQPPLENIVIDDAYAVMTKNDWGKLLEYSCSMPSGVYAGKMWKAIFPDVQVLRWYSDSQKEGMCDINTREILLV